MQAMATQNERADLVGHREFSDVGGDQGVNIIEIDAPRRRIITELVAGQVNVLDKFIKVQRLCLRVCVYI